MVEIDAASHGGVDDARDLRERATFAPARDRYKIFILDEAHMVSNQGFNALLKIVEEPPPHIKFIFATTEPDKVIGTIRSRTHHYPFRLVPPDVLVAVPASSSAAARGRRSAAGVLPLVMRAGGGSVRDSLSVLDQLIAGSGGGEVGYEGAVGLLGYTQATAPGRRRSRRSPPATAARRSGWWTSIIATGHEPRRFVEDVLERLRDLIVIAASGDAADAVLRGVPTDQLERMRPQAGRLGRRGAVPVGGPRQRRPHRDDRRDVAPPAPRAAVRSPAPARGGRRRRGPRRTHRPARTGRHRRFGSTRGVGRGRRSCRT